MRKAAHKTIKHLILSACCALVLQGPAMAAENGQTLFVLDYSGSMWSQANGTPRYRVVREVIGENLDPLENRLTLGIISYGHRSPSSCNDHALLQKPARLSKSNFTARIKKLKPNGRTPLTRAMVTAAKTLGETTRPDHIIVIADGFDNCGGDPCAQTRLMHEKNANLRIHVIAFGASNAHAEKLACISQNTNGKFFSVADKASLSQAIKTTLALAVNPPEVPQTSPKPEPSTSPMVETIPVVKQAPSTLKLATIPLPLNTTPVPRPRLSPRFAKAVELAELNRIPVPRDPPRGRALAALPMTAETMSAAPITTGSINTIPENPSNSEPKTLAIALAEPETVTKPSKPNRHAASMIKPAFFITPIDGGGKQGITLKAQISASLKTIKRDIHWSVYKIDDIAKNKWRKIAEKSAPTAQFDLKQGDYVVRSGFGHANAAIMVSVEPGKIAEATVVFNAGGLRIKPSLAFLDIPEGKVTTLSLIRLGTSKANDIVPDIMADKIIRLNAGTYRLISKFGTVNAITKTEIIIKPGLLTDVEINQKAALVSFKLAAKTGGTAIAATSWHLLTQSGTLLKKTSALIPSHILAPGDYKIIAIQGEKSFSSTFSVTIGETKSVEVLAN